MHYKLKLTQSMLSDKTDFYWQILVLRDTHGTLNAIHSSTQAANDDDRDRARPTDYSY